jgi:hypothetical protein
MWEARSRSRGAGCGWGEAARCTGRAASTVAVKHSAEQLFDYGFFVFPKITHECIESRTSVQIVLAATTRWLV